MTVRASAEALVVRAAARGIHGRTLTADERQRRGCSICCRSSRFAASNWAGMRSTPSRTSTASNGSGCRTRTAYCGSRWRAILVSASYRRGMSISLATRVAGETHILCPCTKGTTRRCIRCTTMLVLSPRRFWPRAVNSSPPSSVSSSELRCYRADQHTDRAAASDPARTQASKDS
jgi:hypothetical protein